MYAAVITERGWSLL